MILNLHLGMPGLAPNLIHDVHHQCTNSGKKLAHVISKAQWKSTFRNVANLQPNQLLLDEQDWRKAKAALAELSAMQVVTVSQSECLGVPSDCFLRKKALPYASRRVSRLSDLFQNVEMRIHVAITSQFEYLTMVAAQSKKDKLLENISSLPSWAELVERISRSAPDKEIIVWDFERPEKTALAFSLNLLGIARGPVVEKAREAVLGSNLLQEPQDKGNWSETIPADVIEHLDDQYELDLSRLKSMPGVTVIEADDIPDEFHLD